MHPSRRDLIRSSAAAGAALSLAPVAGAVAPQDHEEPGEAVARRRIPSTGDLLPRIGLGTSRTFDADPGDANENLLGVLKGFFAAGGSLVDSSPMYGPAETMVGALLRRIGRDDYFSATKVWTDKGREAGIKQMESSMAKMLAPRMDLMQVHNLVDWKVQLATLKEWKAAGRVRYLGITEMRDFDLVEQIMKEHELDFIQIPYNLVNRRVEERVLPAAQDTGTAVLVMRPFERGRLFQQVRARELPAWAAEFDCTSWAQFFLKFLLGHPAVTCPIPATSKPHHLADNMKGGVGRVPDEKTRKRMIGLMEG